MKKYIITISFLLSLVWIQNASAAVGFDTVTSTGSSVASQVSISTTHTAGGANRYVTVGLSLRQETSAATAVSCTYDGVAMTEISDIGTGVNASTAWLFGLINPNTTTNATVSCSWTNSQGKTEMGVMSFSGAPGGAGTPQTFVGSTATPSVTITSPSGSSDMFADVFATSGGNSISANSGNLQYSRIDGTAFIGAGQWQTGGTSQTVSYTIAVADQTNLVVAPILAIAVATPNAKPRRTIIDLIPSKTEELFYV